MSCNVPQIVNCEHTVLFGVVDVAGCEPTVIDGCLSPIIRVVDCPVIVRAFGMAKCEKIYLEMLGGPNNTMVERVHNDCGCPSVLTAKRNTMILDKTGIYRFNRCVCTTEPMSDAQVEYTLLRTSPRGSCAPKPKCGCGGK